MLSLQRKPSPVLLVENGDAFAAAWISKVLNMHQIPFTTLATSGEAMVELAAAKQGSNPYECTVVPLQLHSSSDDTTASRLASSVHDNGGRIIAAYSEMEFLTEEMVGNRLFDARHCGTVCQNEFLRAVLGDTEKEVEPLLRNPCKTLKTDHEHHAGTRVLIVEDSRANRLIAAAILQNSGFEVDVAGSGAEAIEIFEHTDFDLILMDLQMSGMDGFEATREIRKLKAPKNNTPIIAFSANVMEEIREQCSEAGMNDFVSKPFVKDTLVEKITQWT
jgi:CheY-like chemotaxis protein